LVYTKIQRFLFEIYGFLVYVDTNVYMDLFAGRKDKFRDLGEFALNVFRKVREGHYCLVISDWVVDEFKKFRDPKEIERLLEGLKTEHLVRITTTSEDKKEARRLSTNNFPDALHVVLARKANCIYLVTRNIQDFAEFQNYIEIKIPEEL